MTSRGSDVHRKARWVLCLVVLLAACGWAEPRSVIAEDELKLGETLPLQIKGGDKRSFTISLIQNQFAEISVEQRGATLMATLFDPQNNKVIEMDFPGGGFGPIYLSAIAAEPGKYRLDVHSVNSWANESSYEVTLTTRRDATPTDQALHNAQKAFSQARKNFSSGNLAEAIEGFKTSLAYWQSTNDYYWQSVTQYSLGAAYGSRNREKWAECLNETLRILNLKSTPNVWRLKASALNDLGPIYSSSGQPEKALESMNDALALYAEHGDRRGQASALGNLGFHHFNAGNLSLARELIDKALVHRRAENDKPGSSNLINSLAAISDRLGEPEQALAYATESLRNWEEIGELRPSDRSRVAAVLNNIAVVNDKLGRWDQAFEFYDKALAKYDEKDPGRANPLDSKGELYAALGDTVKARECYEEALKVLAAAGKPDVNLKAGILVHIGQLLLAEDIDAALKYFEEARNLSPGDPRLADVYTNLGAALALKGDVENAMKAYEEALNIQLKLKNQRGQALALQKRGEARVRIGKPGDALEDFNSALAFWKAVKDRRGEAATLNNIARLERDRGNFEAALARNAEAIQIVESLRTSISNRQLQTSYFAAQENYYELDVDLKMQMSRKDRRADYLAAAFESAEKSRARVLLDILNEARLNRGDNNETAGTRLARLREDRANLLSRLSAKSEARTRTLSAAHSTQQIAVFDREIDQLSDELDALETKIRTEDPRFNSLTRPQPATLKEIQQQLDPNTLLIEYFLGTKHSYVWIISADQRIEGFELPPRAQIEQLAEQAYASLSARGLENQNESGPQRMTRVAKAEREFTSAAAALSKTVLDPISSRLGNKRLVVIADGALQTLPFGVLPAPGAVNATATPPLLANNEIVSLPSASVLVLQRRELAQRKPAPLAVAVLADPVFDEKDPRVTAASNQSGHSSTRSLPTRDSINTPNSFQTRALNNMGVGETGGIRRLVYSLQEARAIFKVADPGRTFKALDFKASRATAMSPELAKYRIIHLATHGIMNLSRPELSGVLFSMVDEKGKPQNGYLGLNEIYNLNLPAEMVVLSACETGIGKQIRGEGLIALTRGFMNAGAERVVASLWKVDDRATAELMGEFYNEMFVRKLKPAAALRAAQLTLSRRPARRNPHFWAGFVVQGEWR
jgi:CHAT domain-containing protein/predicted negative regulator of RcsB-dependent stress response